MTLGTVPEATIPREDQLERDEEFRDRRVIVVAMDHGPSSTHALGFALDHVITHHDRLHIVHVLPHEAANDHNSIMRTQAQLLFDKLSKMAHQKGRQHVSFAMKFGEVGKEICLEATRVKAVLLVMGSRGLSRLRTFVGQSNVEHNLRHAATPLLIVPHDYVPPPGATLGGPSQS